MTAATDSRQNGDRPPIELPGAEHAVVERTEAVPSQAQHLGCLALGATGVFGLWFLITEDPTIGWLALSCLGGLGLTIYVLQLRGADAVLRGVVGPARCRRVRVVQRSFPDFRFADAIRGGEGLARACGPVMRLEMASDHDLASLLAGLPWGADGRLPGKPSRVPFEVAYQTEEFLCVDQTWVVASGAENPYGLLAVRVKRVEAWGSVEVSAEIAVSGDDRDATRRAAAAAEALQELANQRSIYRGQLLTLCLSGGEVNEYGNVDSGHEVLGFLKDKPVTREELVLPDRTWKLIERVVFDAFAKRERLVELGIPAKRGLLFHGPPGTGKTYTCRYIYSNLEEITTLVVTGNATQRIKSVCNLARMLQPSLVLLEDVDLAFSSREINLYSSQLGELMDELDGFARDDAVTFLLTTNAIERLEQAVADRPGRISQTIYFGPPTADLRRRYLERYLMPFATDGLDLDEVVSRTEGASQAFLRELINRAVQVCLDDADRAADVRLLGADFTAALAELTDSNHARAAGAIIGFRSGE